MKLYCLSVTPDEEYAEGEGADCSEWFSVLREAKARRRELIKEDPSRVDLSIDAYVMNHLPLKELLLRILNQDGWAYSIEQVVADHSGGVDR